MICVVRIEARARFFSNVIVDVDMKAKQDFFHRKEDSEISISFSISVESKFSLNQAKVGLKCYVRLHK